MVRLDGVKLPAIMRERIKKIADNLGVSYGDLVKTLIDQALNNFNRKECQCEKCRCQDD